MACEHRERRRLHPLRVLQVARRVVRHVERQGAARPRPDLGEELGDVAHLGGERGRGRPCRAGGRSP